MSIYKEDERNKKKTKIKYIISRFSNEEIPPLFSTVFLEYGVFLCFK